VVKIQRGQGMDREARHGELARSLMRPSPGRGGREFANRGIGSSPEGNPVQIDWLSSGAAAMHGPCHKEQTVTMLLCAVFLTSWGGCGPESHRLPCNPKSAPWSASDSRLSRCLTPIGVMAESILALIAAACVAGMIPTRRCSGEPYPHDVL
jgi:hypothetical protein